MGFFDSFRKAAVEPISTNKTEEPAISAKKETTMKKDDKADFSSLLSLYNGYKTNQNADVAAYVQKLNPQATPHKCPYCGVVHPFTATRARKCPACGEKMVVRQGLFVTEEHSKQLEKEINSFYNKQAIVTRVGFLLESAQDHKINKQRPDYLNALAETFRYMAQVENKRDERGYSFWDKAWGYYNAARLEEMKELRQDMMQYTKLPEIFWNMTQMLLDQAKSEGDIGRSEKGKRRALIQACLTLAEAAKFGTDPYFITNIYSLAKSQIDELQITDEDFKSITADAASTMRLSGAALGKYEGWIQGLSEYQVVDPFRT